MAKIVGAPWFQILLVPLILMLVGVLAKMLGRRDGDDSPKLNDFAVGTTILLMVLGTILGDIRTAGAQLPESLAWLIGIIFVTFFSLTADRYVSWVRDTHGLPTNKKKIWIGVIGPNALCLAIFAIYQAQKV